MKPFPKPADWLAPIRASYLIQLDSYTETRNFIHIWLPEGYGSLQDGCCVLDRTEDRRFHMEGDILVTTLEVAGRFRLRGEVGPIEDGVNLRIAVTNISSETLVENRAGVCIQFAAAPSFADSALERYFYVAGGKITRPRPPLRHLDENHAWFWGTAPGFPHNPAPDFPFIGLESRDGCWVVGHGWDSSRNVWGNCHPSISCIHADPWLPAIAPSETVLSSGVLYFMRGNAEDCVARYGREFAGDSSTV